jgi:hypothetical protein
MMRREVLTLPVLTLFLLLTPVSVRAADKAQADFQPDPYSVQRYGPAYRYPQAGWIVLHIEGQPYERGYQHGRLLAPEIAAYVKTYATKQSPKAPSDGWRLTRTLAKAVFLHRFDKEFLEEMKGIADGASAAGARFDNRPIDLVDVVALNCWAEEMTLGSGLDAVPTGLEGLKFSHEQPRAMPKKLGDHCSAFAATGPATADGKVVFGHITMFGLYPSYYYNVWLDIKPAKGHRMVMCTYPGGIQSGMDYHMNSAGILIAETTIGQTRFDIKGMSETSRIRKAVQYAESIDDAVKYLKVDNNGLYTNEWLLADINTNEIAMFELGTHKSKLWRSSKKEWFGNTPGFYWGCNNAKDLEVRLETIASVKDRPSNMVFCPSARDVVWQKLYHKHKGKIGVEFGKEAFTTPPIAAYHSLDAKFTTTDLAKKLRSWALFGPPLGRTWQPSDGQKQRFTDIKPLVSNPWTILHTEPPAQTKTDRAAVDLRGGEKPAVVAGKQKPLLPVPAWHGTLLPEKDGDVWLTTAFAEYERIVSRETMLRGKEGKKELSTDDRDSLAVDLFRHRSSYLTAVRASKDVPLAKIAPTTENDYWYRIASGKGVLALHALRGLLGEEVFDQAMQTFGEENAGKKVTTAQFRAHVAKASGKSLDEFCDLWLQQTGLPAPGAGKAPVLGSASAAEGGVFHVLSFLAELDQTLIVYGTLDEEATNREAAETLQKKIIERGSNFTVPIKSDREVTEKELKSYHLLLIGRPGKNAVVDRCRKALPVAFGSGSFTVRKDVYAHPGSAVLIAAENPFNKRFSVVVFAGLSAEAVIRAPQAWQNNGRPGEVLVLPNQGQARALVLTAASSFRAGSESAKR